MVLFCLEDNSLKNSILEMLSRDNLFIPESSLKLALSCQR
jgi:hypothetical protein